MMVLGDSILAHMVDILILLGALGAISWYMRQYWSPIARLLQPGVHILEHWDDIMVQRGRIWRVCSICCSWAGGPGFRG